jgi:RimJ/RimL family protein N-acetyltransferase
VQLVLPVRTERLNIRALRADDIDRHFAIFSDPSVVRYLYDEALTREQAKEHLKRRCVQDLPNEGAWINYGVELAADRILIGEVGMAHVSTAHRHYEVGYVFDPAYAGQGFATEAAAMIVELAFSGLGAHRVSARLDARNGRSAGVLERLGMRREGHFVENEFVKGEWTDEAAYAVLEDEWRAARGPAKTFAFRPPSKDEGVPTR